MPDQPHPRDLIGGYATSTLSREEREQLLAAALDDQQLFDELVNEEPLRELLNDPLARQKLMDKLSGERRTRDRWFRFGTWRLFFSQPKYLAYCGLALLIAVGAIVVSLLRLTGPPLESGRRVWVTSTPSGGKTDQEPGLSAERLDLLRKRLLEYEASSRRLEALEETTAALRRQPDNPELKRILDAALNEARARLVLARARATTAGELARRSSDYQNAMQKEQDVEHLARSGSTEVAILSAWSATDLFERASGAPEQGRLTSLGNATSQFDRPPSSQVDSDETRMARVVDTYMKAITTKDFALLRSVWPGLPAADDARLPAEARAAADEAFWRELRQIDAEQITFVIDGIRIDGDAATVRISRREFITSVERLKAIARGDARQPERVEQTLRLQKSETGWIITAIEGLR